MQPVIPKQDITSPSPIRVKIPSEVEVAPCHTLLVTVYTGDMNDLCDLNFFGDFFVIDLFFYIRLLVCSFQSDPMKKFGHF